MIKTIEKYDESTDSLYVTFITDNSNIKFSKDVIPLTENLSVTYYENEGIRSVIIKNYKKVRNENSYLNFIYENDGFYYVRMI